MYLGRIVCAGMTKDGKPCVAYRVSSRSFPNRTAIVQGDKIAIMPRAGFESDLSKNPYIAYNCLRTARGIALVTNGSQTDPIIEKIAMGYPVRDAMVACSLAMDYEKDHLNTPRVSAAIDPAAGKLTLGIVRCDALLVREFSLVPGEIRFISTYTCDKPCDDNVDTLTAGTPAELVEFVIRGGKFAEFEHAVTAAAAILDGNTYSLAALDA